MRIIDKVTLTLSGLVLAGIMFLVGVAYEDGKLEQRLTREAEVPHDVIAIVLDGHLLGSLVVGGDYVIVAHHGATAEDIVASAKGLPETQTAIVNLVSGRCAAPTT